MTWHINGWGSQQSFLLVLGKFSCFVSQSDKLQHLTVVLFAAAWVLPLWTEKTWQLGTRKELASLIPNGKVQGESQKYQSRNWLSPEPSREHWTFLCKLQTSKESYRKMYYHAVPSQLFKLLTREHPFPYCVVEETKLCQYVINEITFLRGNFQKQS